MFDTETENSFHTLMTRNEIVCDKISCHDKSLAIPDFFCKKNDLQAVFELKDLNESGTTERGLYGTVAQNITIAGAVHDYMRQCVKKFTHQKYAHLPSALVVTNLRPMITWDKILIPQIEDALRNNFKKNTEIGSVIVTGYNLPSKRIVALHIYENPYSTRHIDKDFFMDINHEYHTLN